MPLIIAENLAKSYGKVVAVDRLNLLLDEGSVCLGLSKCGKGERDEKALNICYIQVLSAR